MISNTRSKFIGSLEINTARGALYIALEIARRIWRITKALLNVMRKLNNFGMRLV